MKGGLGKLEIPTLIALITLAIAGCGGQGPSQNEGLVQVTASLPSGLQARDGRTVAEIVNIKLKVTAADLPAPIIKDMTINQQTLTASVEFWMPAGDQRTFLAEAYNSKTEVIYNGSDVKNVVAGQITVVNITLRPPTGAVQLDVVIHEGPPGLEFTYVPAIGSFDNLKGKVTGGLNPEELAVAVYIKVGTGWWTKPYWNRPLTFPASDGNWVCDITTGGIDEKATEIFAYLVRRDAKVPTASGGSLPSIPDALASKSVVRT